MNDSQVGEKNELAKMIRSFLAGEDRSLGHIHRMEAILTEIPDDDLYDELSFHLAMYCPGGGEPLLYDEAELARELRYILKRYLAGVDPWEAPDDR